LRNTPLRTLTLDQFPEIPPVTEDGATFRENAIKKAIVTSRYTILPVLGEDSGLEVKALGGRPGVRSARFAGSAQDDQANNAKLLRAMARLRPPRRQARFISWMALAAGGKLLRTFQGSCAGSIALGSAGRAGFGYDPLFIPRGHRRTMAQLGFKVKQRVSHRSKAAARLKAWWLKNS